MMLILVGVCRCSLSITKVERDCKGNQVPYFYQIFFTNKMFNAIVVSQARQIEFVDGVRLNANRYTATS